MAEPLWTSEEMLAAMGGRLEGGAFACTGVSIDSRSLAPGDLFVALAAERDGHEFVAAALEKGAAAALVSQPGPGRRLIVDDTLKSLEKLGAAARDRAPDARRGAVTGSVGKTSLTQMIRAGLERAGVAHGSVKSFNNHIGVPLTLARMPRMTERAIFEIGMNHAGEIAPLVRLVRPQAVAITNVGPVHTENFHDGESGVAGAKAEIFEGLEPGGVAVLNADNRPGGRCGRLRLRPDLRRPAHRLSPGGRRRASHGRLPRPAHRHRASPDRRPLGPDEPGRASDAGSPGRGAG